MSIHDEQSRPEPSSHDTPLTIEPVRDVVFVEHLAEHGLPFQYESTTDLQHTSYLIFSDAAVRGEHASWAICVLSPEWSLEFENCGLCSPDVRSSTDAEMEAVAAGIMDLLLRRASVTPTDLHVYTDSLTTITLLQKAIRTQNPKHRNPMIAHLMEGILALIDTFSTRLQFTHVRAHQPGDDVITRYNRRCDELAGLVITTVTGKRRKARTKKPR